MSAALAGPVTQAPPAGRGALRQWEGIFVIMQTPFLQSLEIDEESLRRESDFLARGRVHGVVWPAGAGETASLSFRERMQYSEAVVKEAKGRTTVLIGVHGVNKFEAMELPGAEDGADGLHVREANNTDQGDPG